MNNTSPLETLASYAIAFTAGAVSILVLLPMLIGCGSTLCERSPLRVRKAKRLKLGYSP